jgi:hypothetical protein
MEKKYFLHMIDMNILLSVIPCLCECSGPEFISFRILLLTCLLSFHQTIMPYIIYGNEAQKGSLHSHGNFYINT